MYRARNFDDKSPRESKNSNESDTAKFDHERDTIPCEFLNNSIDKGSTETVQLDPASPRVESQCILIILVLIMNS
jgi:hypothetical protein